jgi:hypothetical protein
VSLITALLIQTSTVYQARCCLWVAKYALHGLRKALHTMCPAVLVVCCRPMMGLQYTRRALLLCSWPLSCC